MLNIGEDVAFARNLDTLHVAVVKLRVNDAGSSGAGCFEMKTWTDEGKLTNM